MASRIMDSLFSEFSISLSTPSIEEILAYEVEYVKKEGTLAKSVDLKPGEIELEVINNIELQTETTMTRRSTRHLELKLPRNTNIPRETF